MKVQRSKGMRDLLPADMNLFRLVEKISRQCCTNWGYQEVKTPTIEYLYLFTSAGTLTPGRLGKVYSFLDWDGWSGERVVLRPDGTIPVARLYTENMEADGIARLYYTANIFMFEEDGEKPRERYQLGAELIGEASRTADVELVALIMDIIGKLGIRKVELRLSHAGLIRTILDTLGLDTGEQSRLFDRILEGDEEALNELDGDNNDYRKMLLPLLNLKGKSSDYLRNQREALVESREDIAPYIDDFLKTIGMLDSLGYHYHIDIASGAGFEYYTGAIFQLYSDGEKIGGGGRYDALISAMGGGDVPACGFALYLDRVMRLISPDIIPEPEKESVIIKLQSGDDKEVQAVFQLAQSLRSAGYIAGIDSGKKDAAGYRWVIEFNKDTSGYRVRSAESASPADVPTPAGVLEFLEGNRADKTGSA
ncbi:MAG: ATP phosphoribosyltransferase regulatory subunit [Dehalococcoidia bacterium]|jgi:histidyl-tRNA synthetase